MDELPSHCNSLVGALEEDISGWRRLMRGENRRC